MIPTEAEPALRKLDQRTAACPVRARTASRDAPRPPRPARHVHRSRSDRVRRRRRTCFRSARSPPRSKRSSATRPTRPSARSRTPSKAASTRPSTCCCASRTLLASAARWCSRSATRSSALDGLDLQQAHASSTRIPRRSRSVASSSSELAPQARAVAALSTTAAIEAAMARARHARGGQRARRRSCISATVYAEDIADEPGNETRFVVLGAEDADRRPATTRPRSPSPRTTTGPARSSRCSASSRSAAST